MRSVPPLVPRRTSLGLKALSVVFPGIRHTTGQIEPYTHWWSVQNQGALRREGPLLVAIGDSISIGIGASHPSRSYVGRVAESLSARDDAKWRVINLAIAGARVADALDRQLPIAAGVRDADLYLCCIGTNDVVWSAALASLRSGLRDLSHALPANTIFGPVAGTSSRARLANRALRSAVASNGQRMAELWSVEGPRTTDRLASDRFHPNDLGYALMASSVTELLDAPRPHV